MRQLTSLLVILVASAGLALATTDDAESNLMVREVQIQAEIAPVQEKNAATVTENAITSPDVTIPKRISFCQGRLTDAQANPVPDGEYQLTFRLYTDETGGVPFWTETQTVAVKNGQFSVLLGALNPLNSVSDAEDLYLGIQVGTSSELSPRLRIVSSDDVLKAAEASPDFGSYQDNAWVRGTPDSVLFTIRQLGIARGESDNMLLGSLRFTHTNLGVACTTGSSLYDYYYCTVTGGYRNISAGAGSTVTGGWCNIASGNYSTVSGGVYNKASGASSVVIGGNTNTACTTYAMVGAGKYNVAAAQHAAVVSGWSDTVNAFCGGIFSGYSNLAGDASTDTAATVGGGWDNSVLGNFGFVGGGRGNTASGNYAMIGGGWLNVAQDSFATVAGGKADTVKARYGGVLSGYSNLAGDDATDTAATVAGGWDNAVLGKYGFVGGGYGDTVSGNYATVGAGTRNKASGMYATIAGGWYNTSVGYSATVGGGYQNNASDSFATVAGGKADTVKARYGGVLSGYSNLAGDGYEDTAATIGGGWDNAVLGKYGFVGGGYGDTASGQYATIGGGYRNKASADYATVGGGRRNNAGYFATVGGGQGNIASGSYATVGGGYCSNAAAEGAFAAGYEDSAKAIYSFATNFRSNVLAGDVGSAAFNGTTTTGSNQVRCNTLVAVVKSFTIDHPVDPYNKILNHYSIEGPEILTIYRGSVILDANGRAEVKLPDYFSALNRNPHIQLTGVGTSDVYVAEKIQANRFVIGGKPGTEVYWMVTGERADVSAEAIRRMMPVEQPKTGELAGRMLDDEFLAGCMGQLEREGKAGGINFRTPGGRRRYEEMKRLTRPEQIEMKR